MSIELIVPTLGESITEATVSKWLKKVGESFEADEPLVEIETDKITVEVPAPSAGVLSEITVQEGKDVNIGGVLGIIGDATEITPSKENKLSESKVVKEERKESKAKSTKNINIESNTKLSPSVKSPPQDNGCGSLHKLEVFPQSETDNTGHTLP